MGYNFQLSERLLFLARPEGKSSGSGHNWPLRTDLSRITKPEETRSAQAARSSCKIRVLYRKKNSMYSCLIEAGSMKCMIIDKKTGTIIPLFHHSFVE